MESAARNPLAILKPTVAPRIYTLAEFLRREERSAERHEYYDGKIIRIPMARGPHNIITANTITTLHIAVRAANKKYLVYGSNQLVYLPKLNVGLYPDALAVCEKPAYWDDNQVLLVNPILIIEVISKSTGAYDRSDKFSEYKTCTSLQEYVLIEQDRCEIETRFREEPDLWRETIVTDPTGSIFLKSVGCAVSLADIYENVEFPAPKTRKKR